MCKKEFDMNSNREQGFILVTVLVLLAVLTIAAITSSFKTNVSSKVANMSSHLDQAIIAANAGLTQMYWYWSSDGDKTVGGVKEFKAMTDFLNGRSSTYPAAYKPGFAVDETQKAPTDAQIQAVNSGFKVYTFTSAGVTDDVYTWNEPVAKYLPQAAVWVTTFDDATGTNYPYDPYSVVDKTVSGSKCPNGCRMVTYALGRYGDARKVIRESQSFSSQKLKGVSALTNAPSGDNYKTLCGAASSTTGVTSNAKDWSGTPTGNVMINATQAPFVLGSSPSGIALASNTEVDEGNNMFGFRDGEDGTTGVAFKDEPMLLYSGHDTAKGAKVDFAGLTQDTVGTDLPANVLPKNLVYSGLMTGGDKVEYFSNANENLFSIDHYRWASEQFTCQDPTEADGTYGNGIYCGKAERLRRAMVAAGFDARVPVTGRLSLAQLQWNIANSIPMFGIVRLMLPAKPGSNVTCGSKTINIHSIATNLKHISAQGAYNGGGIANPDTDNTDLTNSADQPYTYSSLGDADGNLGPNARLIVYGTVVIDYFADYDITEAATDNSVANNYVFDPAAGGERILTPLEAVDTFFWMDVPMLINPVMPRFGGAAPIAFPTAASAVKPSGSVNNLTTAGMMNMVDAAGSSTNKVYLASPYDGYFPWSEGMIPPGVGENNAGTMRFMDRDAQPDNAGGEGLIDLGKTIQNLAGAAQNFDSMSDSPVPKVTGLLNLNKPFGGTKEAKVVKYYYNLTVALADENMTNDWPIAPWPGDTFAQNFCIGKADCGAATMSTTPADDHMGDKLHLLFPSGYMHGWKVALAALDLSADEWNTILSGGATFKGIGESGGLYEQVTKGCSMDGATIESPSKCYQGVPFNLEDTGFKSLAAVKLLQDAEAKYFYVTKDVSSGYASLDSKWADIPSTIYSGGLIDIHSHTNMTGVMYTPGPLEWGPGISWYEGTGCAKMKSGVCKPGSRNNPENHKNKAPALSYVNGSIITGYGASVSYTNDARPSHLILVFDSQSVDNVNANQNAIVLRRYDWQMLP